MAAVGDIQPEGDVVRGVKGPCFCQESRRIGRKVATDEGVVDIGTHDVPAELMDELSEQDDGRRQCPGNLGQAELGCEAVVTRGQNDIQEQSGRDVNVEYGLVVEEKHVERVDHQQRTRLLLVGNAVREIKAAEQ